MYTIVTGYNQSIEHRSLSQYYGPLHFGNDASLRPWRGQAGPGIDESRGVVGGNCIAPASVFSLSVL